MEPYQFVYPHGDLSRAVTLYYGASCEDTLPQLAPNTVQTCVTSPPYYGLRDYGTGQWSGGDPACPHQVLLVGGAKQTQGAQSGHARATDRLSRKRCECGALREDRQVGLEETPEAYVERLVGVFDKVLPVLRTDGTLWVNLGDTYAANRAYQVASSKGGDKHGEGQGRPGRSRVSAGLKPKDLIGIPWAFAFAMRNRGWYLRSDIIWSKGNPMPESVTDRPVRSHEYVFLFSRSEHYYYDHHAVTEEAVGKTPSELTGGAYEVHGQEGSRARARARAAQVPTRRNRRTVWTLNAAPYRGAHFAAFPPALVDPCLRAGTSSRGRCPRCSAPWVRRHPAAPWRQTCKCPRHEPLPCVVLDPFSGSGTTGYKAVRLGCDYVGLDLNATYRELAERRILGLDPFSAEESEDSERDSALDMMGE